jgi:hypothetical protein
LLTFPSKTSRRSSEQDFEKVLFDTQGRSIWVEHFTLAERAPQQPAREKSALAKKVYGQPQYVLESPSRAALLLRKTLSEQLQSRTLGSPTNESLAPILIVQRYDGYAISL